MFDLCNVAYFNICKQDAQGCISVCIGVLGGGYKKESPQKLSEKYSNPPPKKFTSLLKKISKTH